MGTKPAPSCSGLQHSSLDNDIEEPSASTRLTIHEVVNNTQSLHQYVTRGIRLKLDVSLHQSSNSSAYTQSGDCKIDNVWGLSAHKNPHKENNTSKQSKSNHSQESKDITNGVHDSDVDQEDA